MSYIETTRKGKNPVIRLIVYVMAIFGYDSEVVITINSRPGLYIKTIYKTK